MISSDSATLAAAAARGSSEDEDGGNQGDLEQQVACHHVLRQVHRYPHVHEQQEPQHLAVGEEGDDR